ncbi:isoprenyl transferase [Marinilabiliaceae bacterium ANBcel2]|nr:isoprenyl transferase [Marinilabiliaceae bacterium ANBcel2]
MSIAEQLNKEKLPKHVAVIMDGNGRWARKRGSARIFGHKNGVKAVREITTAAAEIGINYLTLYAFSTENWSRPQNEINALMSLLVSTIASETKTLMKNDVKLSFIGCIENLPLKVQEELIACTKQTSQNKRLNLILALNYSSRWEITKAIKTIAQDICDNKIDTADINDQLICKYLETKNIPDPELLIRTSGEKRLSNFLLWQIAYAELYFSEVLWPDFRKENFYEALWDFQNRERRFGKTSDQLILNK